MSNKKWNKKQLALLVSLMLMLTVTVGGTLAYLVTKTDGLTNKFVPVNISTDVVEEFDGTTKKTANITNTGDVPVYVRAEIVVTWKNIAPEPDQVLAVIPEQGEGKDYIMNCPASSKWVKHGGLYYYTEALAPGESTENLITDAKVLSSKAGYQLSIDILVQSVQSNPESAVEELWGVNPSMLTTSSN